MRTRLCTMLVIVGLAMANQPLARAATIDFEGLADSDPVTNQFPGLAFTNTAAITAGITLNEFEFPPHSGVNVVFDDGASITIVFDIPQAEVSGFFTYLYSLTLTAFDFFDNQVDSDISAFSSNLALSGDVGSSPNEPLGVAFTGGITRVTIQGDIVGGSFTLDDLTFTRSITTAIPEPSTLLLLASGVLCFIGQRRIRYFIIEYLL